MWLKAPNINCIHGFSTRQGGYSQGAFSSLNLGGNEDSEEVIKQNRKLALQQLQLSEESVCSLKQMHGNHVCGAKTGLQEGDALVSNEPGKALVISVADCYPLLFFDEVNQVIGAAHAGWRGTLSAIAANTVRSMLQLGAETKHIKVAIGQGISAEQFEVGNEVILQFVNNNFPKQCIQRNKIDLIKCNIFVLESIGILNQHIWAMNRCTFEHDFFSYRRDKGITGRMWGLIALR